MRAKEKLRMGTVWKQGLDNWAAEIWIAGRDAVAANAYGETELEATERAQTIINSVNYLVDPYLDTPAKTSKRAK